MFQLFSRLLFSSLYFFLIGACSLVISQNIRESQKKLEDIKNDSEFMSIFPLYRWRDLVTRGVDLKEIVKKNEKIIDTNLIYYCVNQLAQCLWNEMPASMEIVYDPKHSSVPMVEVKLEDGTISRFEYSHEKINSKEVRTSLGISSEEKNTCYIIY